MRPKKRELHELPYTEMVKSGTIRFALDVNKYLIISELPKTLDFESSVKVKF